MLRSERSWDLLRWLPLPLALALGGGHPWVLGASALAVLALALGIGRLRTTPLVLVFAAAAAYRLIQLLPLPEGLREEGWTEEWAPLALDLPGQALGISASIAAMMLASAVGRIRASKGTDAVLLEVTIPVIVTGILLSVLGMAGLLLGWNTPFGLDYIPQPFPTSFVNPNHAGAFLGLAACFALLAALEDERPFSPWLAVALILTITTVLTGSGGAQWALAAAIIAFGLVGRRRWFVLALTAGALGPALLLAGTTTESKIALWPVALRTIASHPWGIGANAYGNVSPHYQEVAPSTLDYVENLPLQILVDYGWLAGIGLIGSFLWIASHAFREAPPTSKVRWVPLLFLGIHGLVDFSTLLYTVSLPAVAMLALLLPGYPEQRRRRPRWMRWAPALGAIIGTGAAIYGAHYHWHHDAARLQSGAAAQVAKRHPSEASAHLALAKEFEAAGDIAAASGAINRALWIAPSRYDTQLAAARFLARRGIHRQAASAYATACAKGVHRRHALTKEVRRLGYWTNYLRSWLRSEHTWSHWTCLATALDQAPGQAAALPDLSRYDWAPHPGLQVSLARRALRRSELAQAETHIRLARRLGDQSHATVILHARVVERSGNTEEAIRILERAPQAAGTRVLILSALAETLLRAKMTERTSEHLDRWRRLATTHDERGRIAMYRGHLAFAKGDAIQARDHYFRAKELSRHPGIEQGLKRVEREAQKDNMGQAPE